MGYRSISEIYEENIANDRLTGFLSRLKDPKFKGALARITHQGTGLAEKKSLYFLNKKKWIQAKESFLLPPLNELYRFYQFKSLSVLNDYSGLISICMTLLSDQNELVQKLAHTGKNLDIPRRNKGSLNLMLQCAMRDDVQALTEAMAVYEKYAVKKRWDELQLEFYRAYIDRDEERIKDVLTELETPKLRRQSIFYKEFIDDYLSVLTAAYLKLCWRNGMEIKIDSPTVPMAMMPVEPLETYEVAYPYLEGWETEEWETAEPKKEEKVYEAVGPYPSGNPSLRSKFVSQQTVRKVVDHFCPKHTVEDKQRLCDFIWEAYTNPEQFDLTHEDYVRKNASFPVTNQQGAQVLESRPFWSELTEYDDEGYFRYCNHFVIMNEMNIEHDKVETLLDSIKADLENKGGFLKRLFS